MKVILITLLGLVFVKIGGLVSDETDIQNKKCCVTCKKEGEVKYYSIDTIYDRCGECCINPANYWIFKIFEPGLVKAEGKSCESLGYSEYENSETHSVFPISVTLDKYKKKE